MLLHSRTGRLPLREYLNSNENNLSEMRRIWDAVRAQVLSSEFIIAYFIFSLVLVSALFLWDTTTRDILISERLYEMDKLATDSVEKLIRTSGVPEDWVGESVDNISSLGLADESRILDQGKVLWFIELMDPTRSDACGGGISNYNCSRHLLGMERYEFYFTITDLDGNMLTLEGQNCSTGNSPGYADYLVTMRRSVMLNNEIVEVSFTAWI
jgi:hypothetical protein